MKWLNPWIGVALLVLAAIGTFLFLWPLGTPENGATRYPGNDPSRVTVQDARLILPAQAGAPATIYLDISNVSSEGIYVTEAALANAGATMIANLQTPNANEAASLHIPQGQTLRLSPATGYGILTEYNSSIVPGATAMLLLKFDDGEIIEVPLTVQSLVQEGGQIVPPSRADAGT